MVKRAPVLTIEYIDGMHHLAYAHEALGEYDEALDLLTRVNPEGLRMHALVASAQVTNQKLRLMLLKLDEEAARAYFAKLKKLQETAEKRAPAVSANLKECVRLADIWLRTIGTGDLEPADVDYVKEEMSLAKNAIHKKEMSDLLEMMKASGA
ncbi:MAG: hypothetical protein ACLTKI_02975 [Lachnospiraceae bacterium]